jgi:acyl-CoA synthetase (AMP-forming)/AMP-acid ligase II
MSLLLMKWERSKETVVSIFRRNVKKHPNKTAFMIDDKKMTFQEVGSFPSTFFPR